MPSRVLQDDSRVDETPSICPQRPQSAGSVSRSERSQNNDTPGASNTQSNGAGQLASLANKTLPSSAANPTPQATENSTTTTNSTSTTGIVSESQAKQATPSSPPSSPQTQATPLSPRTGYFVQQPAASGIEPRSPATRRPPASRSSHGIETSSGPPPALSTQRSYPTEPHWKQLSPTDLGVTRPSLSRAQTTNSIDFIVRLSQDRTDERTDLGPVRAGRRGRRTSRGAEDEMMLHSKRSTLEDDQDRTLRSLEGRTPSRTKQSRYGREEEQSQSSHEDLFLNLAHTDAGNTAEPFSRFERRRSQAGLPSPRYPHPSRPSSSGRLVSGGKSFADQDNTPSPDIRLPRRVQAGNGLYSDSPAVPQASPSKDRSYAASAHPLGQGTRYRYTESNPKAAFSTKRTPDQPNRETSPEPQAPYVRRESIPEASSTNPSRSYKYASNGQHKSSPHNGRSSSSAEQNSVVPTPRAEGTESSASTTAPSTVWDELDDMKSRIRKLELTGKLPQSSGAAMSNVFGDRPPTATTTVTTVSSSPKNRRDKTVSPEASTVRGRGTDNIHPLLHSALARSKLLLDPNMYRVLEATATDALTLAAMTGSTGGRARGTDSPASAVGTVNAVDRQLRRKADSMCRSLTELCIALADDKAETGPPTTKARPDSRDATTTDQRSSVAPEEPRFLRASTQEPEARSSSRIMSRLEARRSSLQAFTTATHRQSSPIDSSSPTQIANPPINNNRLNRNSSALRCRPAEEEEQTPPPVSSRLDRTSSVILHPRQISQNPPVTNNSTPLRSTSRIRAEPSHLHPKRTSREYTSQYPLPVTSTQQQRSPSVHSALPSRRTYFQASTQVPMTPVVQPGSRRYLEQKQTPPSNESPRLQEARERRRALFEQHAGRRIDGSEVGVGSRN